MRKRKCLGREYLQNTKHKSSQPRIADQFRPVLFSLGMYLTWQKENLNLA